jgi:hypothetical protein
VNLDVESALHLLDGRGFWITYLFRNFPDTLRGCNRNRVRLCRRCLRRKRCNTFRPLVVYTCTVDFCISLDQPLVSSLLSLETIWIIGEQELSTIGSDFKLAPLHNSEGAGPVTASPAGRRDEDFG